MLVVNFPNMKIHILLVLLLAIGDWKEVSSAIIPGSVEANRNLASSGAVDQLEDNFEGSLNVNSDGSHRNDDIESYGEEFDAGNPDVHGDIKRPCEVYDTFCIRKYFAEHSLCKPSGRQIPDPLYRAQQTVNFASANITVYQVNTAFGGLNDARITEFYINEATDNLVIAVTFNNASKFSANTYFKYHLRGREPDVTRDAGGIRYGVLTITVVIPHIDDLRLDRSEVYTYGETNIYPFTLGPGIAATTDSEAATMYARFFTNIPNDYQEEIADVGHFIVGNYIQYSICDFGLKVL